jgi:hypothetical protein
MWNKAYTKKVSLEERPRKLKQLELEERDRQGYLAKPQLAEEYKMLESIVAWPKDWARAIS